MNFNYIQQLKNYLRKNGNYLNQLPDKQQDDEELVEIAYQHNPYSLQYASTRLQLEYLLVIIRFNSIICLELEK